LLSCKAYDLESAICAFTPAMGAETTVLPVLNGISHLDALDRHFTPGRVLGGRCLIAATVNAAGEIVHLNDVHEISFGERDAPASGSIAARITDIDREFQSARCEHRASATMLHDMWEKWVFLATLAAATCLCRASIGDICQSPGGREIILKMFEEARALSTAAGFAPREAFLDRSLGMLTKAESPLTASMLRDMESGARIEADHIIGDLIARGDAPLLSLAYTVLKSYEFRRVRS
jgi:2-dehydropantoate 2-reductase